MTNLLLSFLNFVLHEYQSYVRTHQSSLFIIQYLSYVFYVEMKLNTRVCMCVCCVRVCVCVLGQY